VILLGESNEALCCGGGTLPKVATEMALAVLAYNLTRVLNIVGTKRLITAITV